MLDEGLRRSNRGTDVVVGLVETHGRPHTAEKLIGLEVVPRRLIEYRGRVFEEMDLHAVLERDPKVVLVDELAHTNAPGVEHEKRWQDVEALLDAGIDVISTLNLQHLESVNDVVETITGIAQRETVPDNVVRRAEQIELVDMTPEALRRRLAHGNVYPADRIDAALTHFFRPGNLAALRELALLWLADRVDDELQAYRERHGIESAWETKERVVVSVTAAQDAERLIRRAARIAARSKAELVGVMVRRDDGLRGSDDRSLERHVALLEELGGRYLEVVGNDIAVALVSVARAENATQLVVGSTHRSRWVERLSGSTATRCVRAAKGEIDVHIIGTPGQATRPRPTQRRVRRPSPVSARRVLLGTAVGIVAFPLVTWLLVLGNRGDALSLALSAYLLVVIAVAAIGGLLPGLIAALVAFLVSNWEFAPPIHTFTIADSRDLLALASFLVAALTVALLVNYSARRSVEALRARRDALALARMASHLADDSDAVDEMVAEIVRIFDFEGALVRRSDGTVDADVARFGTMEGVITTVDAGEGHQLVVAGTQLDPQRIELLRGVAAQLIAALERRRLTSEAQERRSLLKADELRGALLNAVSHDLRTPLASIKAAATTLLSTTASLSSEESHELLEAIDTEADRLDSLVEDLLDMSRVQQGSIELVEAEVDLVELVDVAVAEAQRVLSEGTARVERTGLSSATVVTDPALVVRVVYNLVLNALTHGQGSSVSVDVGELADSVTVRVIDHGAGIPVESRHDVFRPFQRLGDVGAGHGVGLGLSLARGFFEALGGTLEIEDTPGGGCTMVLEIPCRPLEAGSPEAVS
jgi:two-component system sensor histidine kinase KdpD